jgi:hypothetical protein
MTSGGARTWYFPDGYLPEKQTGAGGPEAHEALMLLNVSGQDADVELDFYFEGHAPEKGIKVSVGSERVKTLRLDHPEEIGGVQLAPLTQYAIRVRSSIPIVAQFGRLDTTQANLSYYCAPASYER